MLSDKEFIKSRIAQIRGSKNISARSLSLELGMSSEYINQVENGRLNPSLDFLLNFCDYFKISIGEFFDENNAFPIEYQSLIKELNKLNKQEIEQIINLVNLLNSYKR